MHQKKVMKKILLSALIFSTLAFVSCNDSDDNNTGVDTSGIYLPTKFESEENVQTFVYDSENRLIESKDIEDDGSRTNIVTFVYTNGQLVSAKEVTTEVGNDQTYVSTEDYTFTYQNNEVTVVNVYTSNSSNSTQTSVYTIDSNGKLQSGNGLTVTYDSKGNVTKLVEDDFENTYTYDNQNGMFKNVNTPQWAFYLVLEEFHIFDINNVTKLTYKDSEDAEEDFSNISYQYNSANYPVKMNVTGSDDFSNSVTIEYIKK